MRIDPQILASARTTSAPGSPAQRIVLAIAWVTLIALLPGLLWVWQIPSAIVLVLLTRKLGLSPRALFRRTLMLWPFLALTAAGLLGQPDGLLRIGNLFLKAGLSVWILTLLTHTTSVAEWIAGLRRLHFPVIWVELFAFLFRYVGVLASEWSRMQLAREARTFHLSWRRRFVVLAQSLGGLFIRAYERAERIQQAMLARGYRFR